MILFITGFIVGQLATVGLFWFIAHLASRDLKRRPYTVQP